MNNVIQKYKDHLSFPFKRYVVTDIQLSCSGNVFIFIGATLLKCEYRCRFHDCDASMNGERITIDVAGDIGREHIWSLLGRYIEYCNIFNNGDLQFMFDNNLEITIHPIPGYEHWELEPCLVDYDKFSCGSDPEGGYSMRNKVFKVVEIKD